MEQKLLLIFQQSELDAVKMYQVLTEKAAGEDEKQLLRGLGAIEGRHAAVLRGITGVSDLKPTDKMAKPIGLLREKLGKKATYTLLALGEHGAYYLYQPFARKYDALKQVAHSLNAIYRSAREPIQFGNHQSILRCQLIQKSLKCGLNIPGAFEHRVRPS